MSILEQGSIKIVGRQGTKFKFQCLKEDVEKLPMEGISCGSSCLVLDAAEEESPIYVFHEYNKGKNKKWFPL